MAESIAAHVIPTAVRRNGSNIVISATLALRPLAGADETQINDWPAWIKSLIEGSAVVAQLRRRAGEPPVMAGSITSLFTERYAKAGLCGHGMDWISELWRVLLQDQDGTFKGLRAALAQPAHDSLVDIARDPVPDSNGVQPQPAEPAKQVPDLLVVPRNDLSYLVTIQRARRIAASVAAKGQPLPLNCPDTGDGTWFERPWTRAPSPLEQLAMAASANPAWGVRAGLTPDGTPVMFAADDASRTYDPFRYAPETTLTPGLQTLKNALTNERMALDSALKQKLVPKRRAIDQLADAARQLQSGDVKGLTGIKRARGAKRLGLTGAITTAGTAFQSAFDDGMRVHVAAGRDDYGEAPYLDFNRQETAEHRWFALQGLPALQRLLHLAVDIELTWPAREFAEVLDHAPAGSPRFVEIGVAVDGGPAIFTLTKVTLEGGHKPAHCWPATIEERLESANAPASEDELRMRATIDQFGGIVDLEASTVGDGGVRTVRFDVDGLDVIAAAESEVNRQRAIAHVKESVKQLRAPSDTPLDEALESACADRKLRTAGLRVVDQWRDSAAVKEFTRAHDELLGRPGGSLDGLVLDADDLTIGFKLDVAVVEREGEHRRWTSLTDRIVRYTWPATLPPLPTGITLDRLVEVFVGGTGKKGAEALRRMLDGATLNMPTRILKNASDQTAFAEPILATWEGDPLSLECRHYTVSTHPDDLPLSLTFDLDRTGADRPNRLRFGAAYWFGARTVMMAGVSRSLEDARPVYENGLDGAGAPMALPARTSELKRYLRFEWIDPPMMATPWPDVRTEFEKRGGLDAGSMVVRSKPKGAPDGEDDRRFGPNRTRRVLFAPAVDLTFAHLHGVFDHIHASGAMPPTGLQGVSYNVKLGGFPSFVPGSPVEESSIAHAAMDKAGNPLPSGLAVFRRAASGKGGAGYYPDPAARYLVIAIRKYDKPARGGSYLEGSPILIDLYPNHPKVSGPAVPGYPDAVPVIVTVTTYGGPVSKEKLTYEILCKRTGRAHWTRPIGLDLTPKAHKPIEALEIELPLAPGEDVELEAWCVPDMPHLAAWFDAPESIAFLSAAHAPGAKTNLHDDVAKVRALLGASAAASNPASANFVLRRSESVAEAAAVREAADLLYSALLAYPVPGVAAVRRIRAVHAVETPVQAPVIARENTNSWPLRFRRVRENERGKVLNGGSWRDWRRTDQSEGGTELFVGGAVTLDQHAIEMLELRLLAAAPRARAIDDPQLGRTRESRLRGEWGLPPASSVCRPSERLYGFSVDERGQVTLKREQIVLSRWRIDPATGGEMTCIDLLDLTRKKRKREEETSDRFFPDGTARRIQAHVAGTSRTARLIPERNIYPDTKQQELDEQRRIAVNHVINGKGKDEIERFATVLRATVRPAAVPPKSLLPSFSWHPGRPDRAGRIREFERRTRIRLRVDRPWFTSGEDERLGIVLWPPNILKAKAALVAGLPEAEWSEQALAQGRIARAEPLEPRAKTLIDVVEQNVPPAAPSAENPLSDWRPHYFTDQDLGPGGAYITRWGADPIHEEGSLSWFLHAGAFKDVDDWRATALDSITGEDNDTGMLWPETERYQPRLVENVLMPVPEAEDKSDETSPAKQDVNPADINFMLVSLVTYAPLFDVDMEQWYVDVEIDPGVAPDPFLRLGIVRFQPHANRRVQVSYPTAEWVQITGFQRRVSLDVDEAKRTTTVRAEIPRLANFRKDGPRTVLRATLIERRKTDSGTIVERVVRRPRADGQGFEPYVQTVGAEPVASRSWIATFNLPPAVADGDEVAYAVLVEEIYVMPRATFESEPRLDTPDADQGITDPTRWQQSGARFAVRLEV